MAIAPAQGSQPKGSILPQNQPEELVKLVGHIAEREVEAARGDDDRTLVREGVEAQLAVVAAHAGVADTPEGDLLVDDVHDGVVDASAAGGGAPHHGLAVAQFSEEIQRQRFLAAVHKGNSLIQRLIGADRQDRTEDLGGHHCGIRRRVQDDRGLDVACGRVGLAAAHGAGGFRAGDVGGDAREGLVADQADEVLRVLGILAQQGMDLAEVFIHESAPYLLINQYVVRSNAGLSGIQGLAPGEALRGQLEVGVGRDDAGALPAQFQHHGGQVLGGGLHYETSEGRAAGEEDDVPALR